MEDRSINPLPTEWWRGFIKDADRFTRAAQRRAEVIDYSYHLLSPFFEQRHRKINFAAAYGMGPTKLKQLEATMNADTKHRIKMFYLSYADSIEKLNADQGFQRFTQWTWDKFGKLALVGTEREFYKEIIDLIEERRKAKEEADAYAAQVIELQRQVDESKRVKAQHEEERRLKLHRHSAFVRFLNNHEAYQWSFENYRKYHTEHTLGVPSYSYQEFFIEKAKVIERWREDSRKFVQQGEKPVEPLQVKVADELGYLRDAELLRIQAELQRAHKYGPALKRLYEAIKNELYKRENEN